MMIENIRKKNEFKNIEKHSSYTFLLQCVAECLSLYFFVFFSACVFFYTPIFLIISDYCCIILLCFLCYIIIIVLMVVVVVVIIDVVIITLCFFYCFFFIPDQWRCWGTGSFWFLCWGFSSPRTSPTIGRSLPVGSHLVVIQWGSCSWPFCSNKCAIFIMQRFERLFLFILYSMQGKWHHLSLIWWIFLGNLYHHLRSTKTS